MPSVARVGFFIAGPSRTKFRKRPFVIASSILPPAESSVGSTLNRGQAFAFGRQVSGRQDCPDRADRIARTGLQSVLMEKNNSTFGNPYDDAPRGNGRRGAQERRKVATRCLVCARRGMMVAI